MYFEDRSVNFVLQEDMVWNKNASVHCTGYDVMILWRDGPNIIRHHTTRTTTMFCTSESLQFFGHQIRDLCYYSRHTQHPHYHNSHAGQQTSQQCCYHSTVWGMVGSNLDPEIGYSTSSFCGVPQSLQQSAQTMSLLHILLHPQSIYYSTCKLSSWKLSLNKLRINYELLSDLTAYERQVLWLVFPGRVSNLQRTRCSENNRRL